MTTAIGIVITEHIVAGRLENQRLSGKPLRYPDDPAILDALSAIPGSELVDMLAAQIAALANSQRHHRPSACGQRRRRHCRRSGCYPWPP